MLMRLQRYSTLLIPHSLQILRLLDLQSTSRILRLPLVLERKTFTGHFLFDGDAMIHHRLSPGENLEVNKEDS